MDRESKAPAADIPSTSPRSLMDGTDRPIAMTVDLEDWYHSMFQIAPDEWDRCEDRVLPATERLLALLDEHSVKATFFVLGHVAQHHKTLVRAIAAAGHEVACHGFYHRLVHRQTPEAFKEDVIRARDLIQEQTGTEVSGYRAAYWSITRECLWAFDILAEAGFRYDSSVYPTQTPIYGIPDAPLSPSRVVTRGGNVITEFPPAVLGFPGRNVPFAGGLYLRMLPARFVVWGIRRLQRGGREPLIYVHPPEFDPQKPRIPMNGLHRFLHYANLDSLRRKIPLLLSKFEFAPIIDIIDALEQQAPLNEWCLNAVQ
jgi:polysaccharide deacetylase family protein (PEP-CTERM system associated)